MSAINQIPPWLEVEDEDQELEEAREIVSDITLERIREMKELAKLYMDCTKFLTSEERKNLRRRLD